MKLLVLGGTEFVGRHLVEAALAAGHEVTLFNRRRRNPTLFSQLERLVGDRRGNLSALVGRRWDTVIDTSGYLPSHVSRSAELLRHSVDRYVFISTISVYSDFSLNTIETAPVEPVSRRAILAAEAVDPPPRTISGGGYGDSYGGLKALCERQVEVAMAGNALVVRPGFIIGANDYSGRYSYWVNRLDRNDVVLAPGDPSRHVRITDVRDLAEWIMRMVSARRTGTFNATGPDDMTMQSILLQTRKGIRSRARLIWVPEEKLVAKGDKPVEAVPFWLPQKHHALFQVRNDRAVEAGLRFRPISQSARAVQLWLRANVDAPIASGLSVEQEAQIIMEWKSKRRATRPHT